VPSELEKRPKPVTAAYAPSEPAHPSPSFALGLRTQITFALVTGLGLLVVLVAITADRFALRAIERERQHAAEIAASAAAELIGRVDAPPILVDRADAALVGSNGILGFEIRGVDDSGAPIEERRGLTNGSLSADHVVHGGRVRVFVASAGDDAAGALVRLLVLYALVSAIGILVLSYALLTRLIVRPIGALTLAADRLARGVPDARAEPSGAAEIAQLAMTFNAMARDLAQERRALEARLLELERTTVELRSKEASLVRSEKLASVGRLAAGVAHEIGNPLTSILGLVDLLEAGDLPPKEQAEFLGRIHAETDRIHRTIRDLLDFARKSPEEDAAEPAEVRQAVERAVSLVTPQKDMRKVTLLRQLPDEPLFVLASDDHLVQVLLNLLMNAADAIAGEGTISIEVEADEEDVVISVSDSGPGIAEEVRAHLFEPFVTTKPSGEGTGLGLAVCHSIAERAGGTIRAESPASGGARLVVRLPQPARAQATGDRGRPS
jgi:signal transduction histidine kinase